MRIQAAAIIMVLPSPGRISNKTSFFYLQYIDNIASFYLSLKPENPFINLEFFIVSSISFNKLYLSFNSSF